ncbi:MAG: lactate racemase domain-containing protein [Chloroflexota bacterium]
MPNTVKLPRLAPDETRELELSFPESWEVAVCPIAGGQRPRLRPEEIKQAVAHPIGTPPLRELARGKRDVAIIFDDTTRVTRTAEIVPPVLEELALAAVPDSRIRFIAALGAHGAMNRTGFARKLGEATLARFPVYNHNPLDKGAYVGTTSYGTMVFINAEVARCDLKIGIGTISPHIRAGFGGGGKIILPGVAALPTIEHLHTLANQAASEHREKPVIGMGIFDGNPMRANCQEAAKLAGLDFIINCLHNQRGETVAVYAGAPELAFARGVEEAKKHYLAPKALDKDVVVANAFSRAGEAGISLGMALASASLRGSDIVLVCNAPEGQVTHYLLGSFGNSHWSRLTTRRTLPAHIRHLIIFTDYPDPGGHNSWLEPSERVVTLSQWDDVLGLLIEGHGDGSSVAVYPSADCQFFAPE